MKLNKKQLIGLFMVVIMVFAMAVFFSRNDEDATASKSNQPESPVTAPHAIPSSRDVPNSPAKPFVPKTAKEKRLLEMGTTMDVDDIRFYGRVIDQHGQPVAGAEVPYQIGGSALGGYRGEGKKVTDANGEFSIETEGSGLSLGRISHPDIEFGYPTLGKPGSWGYSHSDGIDIYGFQPQAGDNQALWTDTSPEKPYIFKAWRIGKGEGEVARSLMEGEYAKSYEYGKFYTLDFSKSFYDVISEGKKKGHLHVIFQRVVDEENATQQWEARLIPVDGGIQATEDTYMNFAPETGYQSEIHIVREKKSSRENIDNLANRQYYFTSNNGQVYGSLFVRFNANSYGKMGMRIRSKINPDGERILVKGKEHK